MCLVMPRYLASDFLAFLLVSLFSASVPTTAYMCGVFFHSYLSLGLCHPPFSVILGQALAMLGCLVPTQGLLFLQGYSFPSWSCSATVLWPGRARSNQAEQDPVSALLHADWTWV